MKSNGITSNFSIQPLELNHISTNKNWMNSPKGQPIVLMRHHQSTFENINVRQKQLNFKKKEVALVSSSKNEIEGSIFGIASGANSKVYDARHISVQNNLIPNHQMSSNALMMTQNVPPNNVDYQEMHLKLNVLEDKLSKMRQRFNRQKDHKDNNKFVMQKQAQNAKKPKSNLFQNACEPFKNFVTQVSRPKNLKQFEYDGSTQINQTYYISEVIKAFQMGNNLVKDHITTSMQIIKTFQTVKGFSKQQLLLKKVSLPKNKSIKSTVIFDLDETLIHCNQNVQMPSDVKLKVGLTNGDTVQVGINIRPYACQILREISKTMQVIVFTASHSCYANVILDYLDPQGRYISHRLFREHCFQTDQGVYIKDLRILNRQLSQVVLVDNAAYSYILQLQNGIPIIPFYNNKQDNELKSLEGYLKKMGDYSDIRDFNRSCFRLGRYRQFDRCHNLVEALYASV